MSSLLININNLDQINNTKKIKIIIDTICFQPSHILNSPDISYIWEQFLTNLPNNKDNFTYDITLLQRVQNNKNSYQIKKELNFDNKFKIKQIPEFNYITMNQDVDMLNNICKINDYDVFISTSFTYCNSIPNIVIVYDINIEKSNLSKHNLNTHNLIQKNKAILNGSAFITFSKKTYKDLLDVYPHIHKNSFSIDIIKHNISNNISNNISQKYVDDDKEQFKSLDKYLSTLQNSILKPHAFINIILQSYPETNTNRTQELKYCIRKNLENPYVKIVYDFGSGIELFDNTDDDNNLKQKYKQIINTKWLTFEMAINFANSTNSTNSTNSEYWCIMNLDIFLDSKSNWNNIRGQLNNGFIYAQSRHEFNIIEKTKIVAQMDSNFSQLYHANTQDAWLFKTPIECQNKNSNGNGNGIDFDFELGFLGCDNAIADRFVKSGYKVINQPMTYKIYHYDIAKGKTSTNYLEKHTKETKDMTDKMIKPKNKYPERDGSYLVPNYDQMLSMSNGYDIDFIKIVNSLGGCSNWERYEFISKIFSDRIIITNP